MAWLTHAVALVAVAAGLPVACGGWAEIGPSRPRPRGFAAHCDLCQFFVLLGSARGKGHSVGEPGSARGNDICRKDEFHLAAVRLGEAMRHDHDVGHDVEAFLPVVRSQCLRFWAALDARSAALEVSFEHLQLTLCEETLLCNAYTVWSAAETSRWRAFIDHGGTLKQGKKVEDELIVGITINQRELVKEASETHADADVVQEQKEGEEEVDDGEDEEMKPEDPLTPRCPPSSTSSASRNADLVATRVVVVVFSGRGSRLRLLLPYLRRDLREHGGVVDRLIFALVRPDLAAIQLIQKMQMLHRDVVELRDFTEETWGRVSNDPARHRMAKLYTGCNESGTVYVKIDDDIVYLADDAIAEMVREKLRNRCLFVSGNVVNHAILSAVHQDRGAHRAFEPPPEFHVNRTCRLPWVRVGDLNLDASYTFERYPMSSCVLRRWDCAAIVHESFLDRHREGTLCAFDFGWLDFNRAGFREHSYVHLSSWVGQTWEAKGARWSINLFAFRAEDMEGMDWSQVWGPGDDEEAFGGAHGERKNGHACAIGRSLAVHFSYTTQEERLLRHTNLLERYADLLANGSASRFLVD